MEIAVEDEGLLMTAVTQTDFGLKQERLDSLAGQEQVEVDSRQEETYPMQEWLSGQEQGEADFR